MRLARTLLAAETMVVAPLDYAHSLGVPAAGFVAGLAHPFPGLDHLAASFAIGLYAA